MRHIISTIIFCIFWSMSSSVAIYAQTPQENETPIAIRDIDTRGPALIDLFHPHVKNGSIIGYTATERLTSSSLGNYGVLSTDIITQINGILVTSDRRLTQALRNTIKAQTIHLRILRDGNEISIYVPTK